MTSEIAKRASFKVNVSPHLEALLQASLKLTKDGRAATRLLRATIAEAYRSWTEPPPAADCRIWLRKVLTRRFLIDFQELPAQLDSICGQEINQDIFEDEKLTPATATERGSDATPGGEFDEDVIYFRAIAGLPAVIRPAMILSCLEGFSSGEIANLAGVQSFAVESLLERGRTLLQDELFGHLMSNEDYETMAGAEQR